MIFGNSSSQDFALAAKYVPICKCDKESGPFAVTMRAKPNGYGDLHKFYILLLLILRRYCNMENMEE